MDIADNNELMKMLSDLQDRADGRSWPREFRRELQKYPVLQAGDWVMVRQELFRQINMPIPSQRIFRVSSVSYNRSVPPCVVYLEGFEAVCPTLNGRTNIDWLRKIEREP